MKYIIHFKSGGETGLSRSEYNRFQNKARANEVMELENGNLMSLRDSTSWDWIEVVMDPGEIETHSWPMKDAPTFEEVIHPEVSEEKKNDEIPPDGPPITENEDQAELVLLSQDEVKARIEKSGLSANEFAASIGYSPQSVRMIIKEGRISQPLSDKIREVYPD